MNWIACAQELLAMTELAIPIEHEAIMLCRHVMRPAVPIRLFSQAAFGFRAATNTPVGTSP
jgi:hypothetical protein